MRNSSSEFLRLKFIGRTCFFFFFKIHTVITGMVLVFLMYTVHCMELDLCQIPL